MAAEEADNQRNTERAQNRSRAAVGGEWVDWLQRVIRPHSAVACWIQPPSIAAVPSCSMISSDPILGDAGVDKVAFGGGKMVES